MIRIFQEFKNGNVFLKNNYQLYWIVFTCLIFISFYSCQKISPTEWTDTAISSVFYRIHLFAKENKRLPKKISELPKREGNKNTIIDGWGRELKYKINRNKVISVYSLGRDGKVGGLGTDEDIIRRYRTIDQNGNFIVADDLWIVEGELEALQL